MPCRSLLPDFANTTSKQINEYFVKMVGEEVEDNKVSKSWASGVKRFKLICSRSAEKNCPTKQSHLVRCQRLSEGKF